MLWVDGRTEQGPVLNTAVISSAAPTYAPVGRHLIAASALLTEAGDPPPEAVLRAHAAEILGANHEQWHLVTRHVVPRALPAQPPPLSVRRPVRTRDGLWVCGDHRDTASIQGALVSGRRTAEAILLA
jgi:predicted NAD/FAD-dependent oxidoreductase